MKVTIVFSDNDTGDFDCTKIRYEEYAVFLDLTNGRKICVPYSNAYMITEEVTE